MEVPQLEIGPGLGASVGPSTETAESMLEPSEPAASVDALVIPDPIDYQAEDEAAMSPAGEPELIAARPLAAEADEATPLAAASPGGSRMAPQRVEIRRIFGEPVSEEDRSLGKLLVVVETLSPADEPVGAEGEVSMMIMARDAPGSFQRIERWDFTPQETAAAWQSSQLGDGLHLELPLHRTELPDAELELWARVVTSDGRKMLTQTPLVPSQLASMNDAVEETSLAVADAPPGDLDADAVRPIPTADLAHLSESRAKPKPQWRAATRIEPSERDDASGISVADGGAQPEIAQASTAVPPKSRWKRSPTAAASESAPFWGPNR
jgi:hypothetical protein